MISFGSALFHCLTLVGSLPMIHDLAVLFIQAILRF